MNKSIKLFLILIATLLTVSTDCLGFSCNNHAYKDCIGDSIFWYDSCSNMQDLYQNCGDYNLTCQYGQCVYKPEIKYVLHYQKSCYENHIYWYDSLGNINDFYQTCIDSNSCTLDTCKSAQCANALVCDGSTCNAESDDYKKYCGTVTVEDTENKETNNLSISFFTKEDEVSQQWNKSMQLGQNGLVYFMIVLNNNFESQIDNVVVSAEIPSEISYLGNLKIDDVAVSGDIVSGIEVGSVQPMSKKTITFEGKTQAFTIQEEKQATAFINSVEPSQSDSVLINFDLTQSNLAAVSPISWQSTLWQFLKRWYMWIIAGIVMILLFITVFKRISSNV